jgi:hypothetical protein
VETGGCACRTALGQSDDSPLPSLGFAMIVLAALRRRIHRSRSARRIQ